MTDEQPPALPAPAADPVPPPVFIHSSFRTSSTWFWNEFRIQDGAMGFCEIFHEVLATLRKEDVAHHVPDAWRSNHPAAVGPYFTEFLPLIAEEGGVAGYSPAMAFDRYLPAGGLHGAIGEDEAAYVQSLIALAQSHGKRAVPSCTRMLGRIGALKRRFGGVHVFLYRNLFQQWMSYCCLSENHNPYFANTLFYTLDRNRHDPFLARLADSGLTGIPAGAGLDEGELVCDETAFVAFIGLHLYLSMHAHAVADCAVDANALVHDPGYRRSVEERIASATGFRLDLSGARESIEFAGFFVRDTQALRGRIDAVLSEAVAALEADPAAAAFGRRLADETMSELARHQLHTRAVRAILAEVTAERDALAEALDRVQAHAEAQREHIDALLPRVGTLQERIDQQNRHAEELGGRIDELQGHIDWQNRHAGELRGRIDELQALIDGQTARIGSQEQEKAGLIAQVEHLLRHADAQQAHIAVLLPRIDQLQARIDELDREQAELQERHARLLADHAAACAQLNAILSSTSWKVTAPIRWLGSNGPGEPQP